eukprot:TRINITY_DN2155_c1_g1_i11.p1 TRINITY_DN2155_c1_g1~~TRINITY_DN2155_c1_g1_i11.p1  ORF type:complete len:310 (+),score=47.94 TRINITY_DN2155_c1_g1_i11:1168-2097(+)
MEETRTVGYPQAIFIPHNSMFEERMPSLFEEIEIHPYMIFLLPSFQTFEVKDEENCSLSIPATPPFSPYYNEPENNSNNDTPNYSPASPSSPLITPLPVQQSPKKQRNSRSKTTHPHLLNDIREVSVRVPLKTNYVDFKFYVDNNSIYFSDNAASLLLDVNQSTLRGHLCQLAKKHPEWRISGKSVGLPCNLNNMAMINQAIKDWPKEGPLFHINLQNTKHFLSACRIPYEDRSTYVVMKPYPLSSFDEPSSNPSSTNKRKRDDFGDLDSHDYEITTTTTTTSAELPQFNSFSLEGEGLGLSSESEIDL